MGVSALHMAKVPTKQESSAAVVAIAGCATHGTIAVLCEHVSEVFLYAIDTAASQLNFQRAIPTTHPCSGVRFDDDGALLLASCAVRKGDHAVAPRLQVLSRTAGGT